MRCDSVRCHPPSSANSTRALRFTAPPGRLLLAGLATGIIDDLFASAQTFFFKSTVTRLWQAVALTLLGKAACDGETRTALIGVLMHFGVALRVRNTVS